MHEAEKFFLPISKSLDPWGAGMGGYTSKCEKSQNHCTLLSVFEGGFFLTLIGYPNLMPK